MEQMILILSVTCGFLLTALIGMYCKMSGYRREALRYREVYINADEPLQREIWRYNKELDKRQKRNKIDIEKGMYR